MLSDLLDPWAFARFCVYMNYDPGEIVQTLADPDRYGIRSDAAQLLVSLAVDEHAEAARRHEALLDGLARECEFQDAHGVTLPIVLADVNPAQAAFLVRDAYRATRVLVHAGELREDELIALVHGAYLVEPMHAAMIVQTVLDERNDQVA
jgi:hypothetical protein